MSGNAPKMESNVQLKVTDPEDFTKDGALYRRNVLISTSLLFVLMLSDTINPVILGVKISPFAMWFTLSVAHIYQFIMWRLTSPIEGDNQKTFLNLKGLWKQSFSGGTKGFPSKMKAQMFFLRALPIWAFLSGVTFLVISIFK